MLCYYYIIPLTLVLVFDCDLICVTEFSTVDALHHQNQLVIRNVLVVDGDATDVIAKLNLDNELPAKVKLVKGLLKRGCHPDNLRTTWIGANR